MYGGSKAALIPSRMDKMITNRYLLRKHEGQGHFDVISINMHLYYGASSCKIHTNCGHTGIMLLLNAARSTRLKEGNTLSLFA